MIYLNNSFFIVLKHEIKTKLLALKQSIITILKKLMQKVKSSIRFLTKSIMTIITSSSVCCTYIICLTRAMFTNIDTQKKFEKDLSLPQIIMRSFSYYNIFKNSPKVNCLKRLDKYFEHKCTSVHKIFD